jgi:hypothetical protein
LIRHAAGCLSAILLAAVFPGCAPSPESVAAGAAVMVPASQGATIKVYRSFSAPAATAARVYLDDAFLGYVSSRSQNTFHVKPGTYRLSVRYPTGPPPLIQNRTEAFTISRGQTFQFGIGFDREDVLVGSSRVTPLSTEEATRANERYPSRE